MQFAESNLIWLLTLVPLVALLRYYSFYSKYKELSALACPEVIKKIFTGFDNYARSSFWQSSFITLFVLLLVIAALRPQYGFVWQESKRKGVDIVVAIDVSLSMLSEDVKPNRLQRAKREIYDLLDALQGDRISLVAYSGVAFTEAPLTEDYATFRLFLKLLETSLIPIPGTNIGAALEKSIEAFGSTEAIKKSQKSRAIVLITDGEDLEGEYKAKAQKAKELGIKIFILGVGTTAGAPINTPDGYKKDDKGTIIITKLNETVLKELAEDTGGIYVQSMTSEADTDLLYKMGIKKQLEDQAQKSTRAKRWNEYFQFPLAIALIIMLWSPLSHAFDVFRQIRKNTNDIYKIVSVFLLLGITLFNAESAVAQNKERLGKEASDLYREGDFESSRKSFETGVADFGQDYRFDIGSGAANYRLGNFKQAAKYFHDAFEKTKDPKEQAKVLYDKGNALVQLDQLEEAIKTYEDSLKLVPDDKNTIENLAYAKRLLEQQKQQDQKDDNKNNQDKENQQGDKEQQQQSQDNSDQQKSDQQKSEDESKNENSQNKQQEQPQNQNQQQNTQQPESEQQESQEKSDKNEKTSKPQDSFNHDKGGKEISQQQAEALLEGVQENRNNLQNFRKQEALEQLRQMGKTKVEKDW